MRHAPVNSDARLAWGFAHEKHPVDLFARCENIEGTSAREPAMHSTNYTDTLILPSEDCRVDVATVPEKEGSVAQMLYERIAHEPYSLQSDDLLSTVAAVRKDIPEEEHDLFRAQYFSKGQACLRASPLVKSFGWAVHHDKDARIALVDPNSARFQELSQDASIKQVTGMRNKRA